MSDNKYLCEQLAIVQGEINKLKAAKAQEQAAKRAGKKFRKDGELYVCTPLEQKSAAQKQRDRAATLQAKKDAVDEEKRIVQMRLDLKGLFKQTNVPIDDIGDMPYPKLEKLWNTIFRRYDLN